MKKTKTIKPRIIGYTEKFKERDAILPSKVTIAGSEYTVTGIGENAFYDCKNLNSVTIPNTITEIGKNAFDVTRTTRYYQWRKIK